MSLSPHFAVTFCLSNHFPLSTRFMRLSPKKKNRENYIFRIYHPQRPLFWLLKRLVGLTHIVGSVMVAPMASLVLLRIVVTAILMDIRLRSATNFTGIPLATRENLHQIIIIMSIQESHRPNINAMPTTLLPQMLSFLLLLSKMLTPYFQLNPIKRVKSNIKTFWP